MEAIRHQLPSGDTLLVSPCDAHLLSKFRWSSHKRSGSVRDKRGGKYVHTYAKIDGKPCWPTIHRVIMQPPPGMVVDHIDGNGLNNTRENLRIVTQRTNLLFGHRRLRAGADQKSSKYHSVYRPTGRRKFSVMVAAFGGKICVGTYENEDDAGRHADAAAVAIHGRLAVLNFPGEPLVELRPKVVAKILAKLPAESASK